jgi:ribose transport system substrate-binding protein
MKRRTILAATLLAFAMTQAPAPASAAEGTIAVIVKNTSSFYWRILLAGARKAGQELGIEVAELGPQVDTDIAGQISILENAVSSAPLAVVIAASQFAALGGPITEAAQSVKVIGVDSGADTQAYTSFLTTDNVEGGRVAAEALVEAIVAKYGAAEGEVALITSVPGAGSLDARAQGFKEVLAAKYPNITLVADKVADGQPTTALNIMTDLMTAYPNLRGIFASSEEMAIGVSQAVGENNAQDTIKVVAFDSNDQLVKQLRDGVVAALIIQDPFRMGYDGVKIAYAASQGEEVPAFIDTGVNKITAANMDEPANQALLSPKVD